MTRLLDGHKTFKLFLIHSSLSIPLIGSIPREGSETQHSESNTRHMTMFDWLYSPRGVGNQYLAERERGMYSF